MSLKEAIRQKDVEQIESLLSSNLATHKWTLNSVIEELLPMLIMQSNLQHKNFHLVKMALFIRRLALGKIFDADTEYQLARLICLEGSMSQWVDIKADWLETDEDESLFTIGNLRAEIENHNVHNAYFYAIGLLNYDPDTLNQFLLIKSAEYLNSTLGHSFSCFLPFALDLIHCHHPVAPSALLSYVMYLCRFNVEEQVKIPELGIRLNQLEMGELLKKAASGDGIVNIHHMITLFAFTEWECAPFNRHKPVPYNSLRVWIGNKVVDRDREQLVKQIYRLDFIPQDFDEFFNLFSLDNHDKTCSLILSMLEIYPRRTMNWLFLSYLQYYKPGEWDPHYFTSLHAALGIYRGSTFRTSAARRMPLVQAFKYFANGVY